MTVQLDAPAIGYRGFQWEGNGPLKSAFVQSPWPITKEPQHAKCLYNDAHPAPQENCGCGIYAFSSPDKVYQRPGAVVFGYDKLIIHPDGWRAATVEIAALIGDNPGLNLLAEAYGVPLVETWEHGTALAQEQGAQPIPEILHAEAEAWSYREGIIQLMGYPIASTIELGEAWQIVGKSASELSTAMSKVSFSFTFIAEKVDIGEQEPKPKFDTPHRRHAAFNAELARRNRPRA